MLAMMNAGLLAMMGVGAASAGMTMPNVPSAIGTAAPNVQFSAANETILFEHTVADPRARHGVLTHLWSTACGGRPVDYRAQGGVAIYRFYLDGRLAVESSMRELAMVHWDPGSPGAAAVPWGTPLFGQTSDEDAFFVNLPLPFARSVKVTAQLPAGMAPFNVYSIIRGSELPLSVPSVTLGGVPMPVGSTVELHRFEHQSMPHLEFIPLVNLTAGSGAIYASGLALSSKAAGSNSLHFLEGCFHLITPFKPLSAGFPGLVLSTGMEDFYDSSFYFHAGQFQLPNAGLTHMCVANHSNVFSKPAPVCTPDPAVSKFSAYRVHADGPLWFDGGAQLLARNGGVSGGTPWGAGKCYNLHPSVEDGEYPTTSVSAWSWVYKTPEEVPSSLQKPQ